MNPEEIPEETIETNFDELILNEIIEISSKFDNLIEIQMFLFGGMFAILGVLSIMVFFIGKGDSK